MLLLLAMAHLAGCRPDARQGETQQPASLVVVPASTETARTNPVDADSVSDEARQVEAAPQLEAVRPAKEQVPRTALPTEAELLAACQTIGKAIPDAGRLETKIVDLTTPSGRDIRWASCAYEPECRVHIFDRKTAASVAVVLERCSPPSPDGRYFAQNPQAAEEAVILTSKDLWPSAAAQVQNSELFPSNSLDLHDISNSLKLNAYFSACMARSRKTRKGSSLSDIYADCLGGSQYTSIEGWIDNDTLHGDFFCCDEDVQTFRYNIKTNTFTFPLFYLQYSQDAAREAALPEGERPPAITHYYSRKQARVAGREAIAKGYDTSFKIKGKKPLRFALSKKILRGLRESYNRQTRSP